MIGEERRQSHSAKAVAKHISKEETVKNTAAAANVKRFETVENQADIIIRKKRNPSHETLSFD